MNQPLPSFSILFSLLKKATGSESPGDHVRWLQERGYNLSPQTYDNWRRRGLSRDGAIGISPLFGVPAEHFFKSGPAFVAESPAGPAYTIDEARIVEYFRMAHPEVRAALLRMAAPAIPVEANGKTIGATEIPMGRAPAASKTSAG